MAKRTWSDAQRKAFFAKLGKRYRVKGQLAKMQQNRKIKSTVKKAARAGKIVKIRYAPKYDDKPRTYYVEPYSYRGDLFYAYKQGKRGKKSGIRAFKRGRIHSVKIGRKQFDPRWEVEF